MSSVGLLVNAFAAVVVARLGVTTKSEVGSGGRIDSGGESLSWCS